MPDPTPGRHVPARTSPAGALARSALAPTRDPSEALALLRRQFASEVERLEASEHYAGFLDAVQSVVVSLGLPTTEAQVLAVCLAMLDNDVTAEDAGVLARVLRDDGQFSRDTTRFGAAMVPADWIEAFRRLPKKGGRYSADECRRFVRLGYPRAAFPRVDATPGIDAPFGFAPSLALPDADAGTLPDSPR